MFIAEASLESALVGRHSVIKFSSALPLILHMSSALALVFLSGYSGNVSVSPRRCFSESGAHSGGPFSQSQVCDIRKQWVHLSISQGEEESVSI